MVFILWTEAVVILPLEKKKNSEADDSNYWSSIKFDLKDTNDIFL